MAENLQKRSETKKKIKDATMALYAQDGLYKISVTGICKMAGLHRSTFYLYYETIDEVIEEVETELLEQMYYYSDKTDFSSVKQKDMGKEDVLAFSRQILADYYTWMYSMRNYFNPLLSENGDIRFLASFEKHLHDTHERLSVQLNLNFDNDYALDYFSGGTFRTLVRWLKAGDISVEELVKLQTEQFL